MELRPSASVRGQLEKEPDGFDEPQRDCRQCGIGGEEAVPEIEHQGVPHLDMFAMPVKISLMINTNGLELTPGGHLAGSTLRIGAVFTSCWAILPLLFRPIPGKRRAGAHSGDNGDPGMI